MKKYIGVKQVTATEMNVDEAMQKGYRTPSAGLSAGYEVTYEDGYTSWSPKEVFEKAYRKTDGLTFGLAIESMKKGLFVSRHGWNNPNISCTIQNPDANSKMTKPYIYMIKYDDRFPLDLSCESILAEDWFIIE